MNGAVAMVERSSTHIGASRCDYRAVSKDGRVFCRKIVEGENAVSGDLCRACPFIAVNCSHLRFSLLRTSPSPLLVRFNGRTELWNDDPPEVRFRQAACSVQVLPIGHSSLCTGCSLRHPIHSPSERLADWRTAASLSDLEEHEVCHTHSA